MSNHLKCPECKAVTSDSVWPCEGWGHFVTDHAIDGTSGTEDPAELAQSGEKMFVCPKCRGAVWLADVGWFVEKIAAWNVLVEWPAHSDEKPWLVHVVARTAEAARANIENDPRVRSAGGRITRVDAAPTERD